MPETPLPHENPRDQHATVKPAAGGPAADEPIAVAAGAPAVPELDYESIHDAVIGTERGRWFLLQYAARNRNADTEAVLAAIGRIEQTIRAARDGGPAEIPPFAPARQPLSEDVVLAAIERLERSIHAARAAAPGEIAPPAPARQPAAVAGPPAADGKTLGGLFSAVAAIRDALDHVQEISRFMHEHNLDRALCANLDAAAAEIARACMRIERAGGGARAASTPAPDSGLSGAIPAELAEEKIADEIAASVADFASEPEAAAGIAQTVSPEIAIQEVSAPVDDAAAPRAASLISQAENLEASAAAPERPVPAATADTGSVALSDAAQLFPPTPRPQPKPAASRAGWLSQLLAQNGRQMPANPVQPAPMRPAAQTRTEVQPIWPARPNSQSAPAQIVPMPRPAESKPAAAPAAQGDPLAQVMALSEEEKIALFR